MIAFARGARTGGADDADVGAGEHRDEGCDELAVSVADQKPKLLGVVAEIHEQVAGLLGHPGAGGMGGDPGDAQYQRPDSVARWVVDPVVAADGSSCGRRGGRASAAGFWVRRAEADADPWAVACSVR
jgi:hypothetical protein